MAALIQNALSPAITSLSDTSLKPLRPNNKILLSATPFKPFSPSNANPSLSFSISRLNVSQTKSKSPKRSCRLLAVCGLVDGNSEGYPGAESSELEAGVTIDIKLPRRSLLVQFTCDKCGERTDRLINRLAYERGLVYVQCTGCERYHKLADNLGLVVEHDLREEINAKPNTDEAFDKAGAGEGTNTDAGAGAGAGGGVGAGVGGDFAGAGAGGALTGAGGGVTGGSVGAAVGGVCGAGGGRTGLVTGAALGAGGDAGVVAAGGVAALTGDCVGMVGVAVGGGAVGKATDGETAGAWASVMVYGKPRQAKMKMQAS